MNRQQRRRSEALRPRIQAGVLPSEDIDLAWSLANRAMLEEKAGGGGPFLPAWQLIMGANRFALSSRVTALAEDLRISDLSVTVRSLDKGAPLPGRTWLEWDAKVEGRWDPLPGQVPIDRVGVLIEADETGQRGTMHCFARPAPTRAREVGLPDISPVAITFDLREDYERPASLIEPASVEDVRAMHARVSDPTMAEVEGSAVITAALSRRFGAIESPLVSDTVQRRLGLGDRRWSEVHQDLFITAVNEAMQEVLLAVSAFILSRTLGIGVTDVRRGAGRRMATHGIDTVPLGYGIWDVPPVTYRAGLGCLFKRAEGRRL